MAAFISQDVFETSVEERKAEEEVTPWKSLPRKVIMKIVLIERCHSSLYGECYLLHLEDKAGQSYRAWSPTRLIQLIKKDRNPDQNVYITSLGTQKINAVKTRNEFEVTFFADGSPITNLIQDSPSLSSDADVSGNT